MWIKAAIAILIILAGLAGTASGFALSFGHKELASQYFIAAVVFSFVAIFLIILKALRKAESPPLSIIANEQSPSIQRGEQFRFNVVWDSHLNYYCPNCKSPLILSRDKLIYRIDGGVPLPKPVPHCLKCDKAIPLYDDDGNHITLAEAKKLLSQEKTELQTKTLKPHPLEEETPKQQASEDYEPDEIATEILRYIQDSAHPYPLEELPQKLNVERLTIENRLDKLKEYRYIRYNRLDVIHGRSPYSLTPRGRQYLVDHPPKEAPAFKPDEIDVKILVYLDNSQEQNVYDFVIASYLKLKPSLVTSRLEKLAEEDFVRISYDVMPLPVYSLTPKGKEFLDKPNPTVPHPSGLPNLEPIQHNILVLIANGAQRPEIIKDALKIHRTLVDYHLGELIGQGYIRNFFNYPNPDSFILTQPGRRYLIDRGLIQ